MCTNVLSSIECSAAQCSAAQCAHVLVAGERDEVHRHDGEARCSRHAKVYCESTKGLNQWGHLSYNRCSSERYSLVQRRQSQRPPACKQTNTTHRRPHRPSERPVPWFGPPSARTVRYCWCCGLCERRALGRYTMERHSHRNGCRSAVKLCQAD